jgi:hypothetical protein
MMALRDQPKAEIRAAESRSYLVGKLRNAFKGDLFDALIGGRHRTFYITVKIQDGVVNHTRYFPDDTIGVVGAKLSTADALQESVRITGALFEAIDQKLEQASAPDWFGEVLATLEACDGQCKPIKCGAARLANRKSG